MPGCPVTIGCNVVLMPGVSGPPDSGVIMMIPQAMIVASGSPLAVSGSMCQMINALTGIPYPLVIPPIGSSSGIKVGGMNLLRMGDRIQIGSGVLLIVGPPAAPYINDSWPP